MWKLAQRIPVAEPRQDEYAKVWRGLVQRLPFTCTGARPPRCQDEMALQMDP